MFTISSISGDIYTEEKIYDRIRDGNPLNLWGGFGFLQSSAKKMWINLQLRILGIFVDFRIVAM